MESFLILFLIVYWGHAQETCKSVFSFGDQVFTLSSEVVDGNTAKLTCANNGGRIVDITDQTVRDQLKVVATNKYTEGLQNVWMTKNNNKANYSLTLPTDVPSELFQFYNASNFGLMPIEFCIASTRRNKWWVTPSKCGLENGWQLGFKLYGGSGIVGGKFKEIFNYRSHTHSSKLTNRDQPIDPFNRKALSVFAPVVSVFVNNNEPGSTNCVQSALEYKNTWTDTTKSCTGEYAYYACQFQFSVTALPSTCNPDTVQIYWSTNYLPLLQAQAGNMEVKVEAILAGQSPIITVTTLKGNPASVKGLAYKTTYQIKLTTSFSDCQAFVAQTSVTTLPAVSVVGAKIIKQTPCTLHVPSSNNRKRVRGYQVRFKPHVGIFPEANQNVTNGTTKLNLDGLLPNSYKVQLYVIHCKQLIGPFDVGSCDVPHPTTVRGITTPFLSVVATQRAEQTEKSNQTDSTSQRDESAPIGLIAGAAGGAIVLILVMVLVIVFWKRHKENKSSSGTASYKTKDSETAEGGVLVAATTTEVESIIEKRDSSTHVQNVESSSELGEAELKHSNVSPYQNINGGTSGTSKKNLLKIYFKKCPNNFAVFRQEFEKLAKRGTDPSQVNAVAKLEENAARNRYKNIFPYDHARVVLKTATGNDYINAAFIDGNNQSNKFIAAQGPRKNTIEDFWLMVWEQNTSIIVMLTGLKEKAKTKCEKYWPNHGETEQFGDIVLRTTEENKLSGIVQRKITLANQEMKRTVVHLQYVSWPDHGIPVTTSTMIYLREMVEKIHDRNHPIVVHCSAGAGRTGTYIAMDVLFDHLDANKAVDVPNTVLAMRRNRTDMVQSWQQFVFIHKLMVEHISLPNSDRSAAELQSFNPDQLNKAAKEEFKQLASWQYSSDSSKKGKTGNPGTTMSTYSYIQDLGCSKSFISASHQPSVNDEEFWMIALNKNPSVIVSLENPDKVTKEGAVNQYGQIQVAFGKPENYNSYQVVPVTVSSNVTQLGVLNVAMVQLTSWQADDQPPSISTMMEVINLTLATNPTQHEDSILACCRNGSTRSGTFIALVNILERLKTENRVDVFRTVKDLRDMRPNMVDNENLYKYCYQVVLGYLSSFDLYANYQ